MNKKSARRRRKNLITKLAMTSALTLGVGAATTLAGQTEAKAEVLYLETLDMTNKDAVEKFANDLKDLVKRKQGDNTAWYKLSLILNGYKGFTQKIETELQASQQKIKELNEQVNKETQGKQDLENQLNKEKEKLESLKKELETEKAKETEEKNRLQKEIAAKDATISELQQQLEASNQKAKALEAEKAALQEKLAMQEQAHAEEKAKLQKEIDELNAQLEKLKHCQDKPMPEPKPEPKPEAKKPEQPKPMTKPGAKKPEQSLPSTGDIRNPFFTPAAIAIMIAAGTIAIPKRKEED
ncbi:TPA: LPXTG cell wall anchor domain-containing protein [Streptococcus equi subsp. zooepidemicus]|nr:LPXTG cell wall anchor domain-containing protein [Streptococcus equi subsp. zooepidemicus]